MEILPVKIPKITKKDNLFDIFCASLSEEIFENTVVVITSKVVAVVENAIASFSSEEEFEQIIYSEADRVLGKKEQFHFFLTEKNGMMMPNAGIDKSNSEKGTALLLPRNSQKSADEFRKKLQKKYAINNVGVVICDSRVVPFRQGITGVALAWSGFVGVTDERGKKDLFGRKLEVSQMAVADNFSSVAQIFFGQANEKIPFIVCKNAPVQFTDTPQHSTDACISVEDDLYSSIFLKKK